MKNNKNPDITRRGVFAGLAGLMAASAIGDNALSQTTAYTSRNPAVNAIIQHARSKGQENLVVVSKNPSNPDGQPRVYLVQNSRIIFTASVGVGKNPGDSNSSITNNATPEGEFNVRIARDAQGVRMSGMDVVDFLYSPDGRNGAAFHATYLGEFNARQAKIKSPSGLDNLFSNGCINADPSDMRVILSFFINNRMSQGSNNLPRLWVAPTSETPQTLYQKLGVPLTTPDLSLNR